MSWADHVHAHGALTRLADRLWRVEDASAFPRNMVVWRMDDGALLLHSVVAVDESTLAEIGALGTPAVMVVPSGLHRMDCGVYADRFPDIEVLCPEACRKAVEKRVRVDATCEARLPDLGVTMHPECGFKPLELVYEVDAGDGRALLFNDHVFHLREHMSGINGLFVRYVMGSTGFFGVTRLGRLLLIADRAKVKQWLTDQAARDDLAVVTMSHGQPVMGDAIAASLREAADRL